VTVSLITYVINSASHSAKKGQLKYGLFIKGLGVVCFLFSVIPFIVFLTGNYQIDKPGETAALIGLTLGFGVGAVYAIGEGFFVNGAYDQNSIKFTTPWTGVKNERWEDLQSIKFNSICYWYVLKFNSGKIIRLSSYLGGNGYLLEHLREQGHDF
jgi:hypothetical protein